MDELIKIGSIDGKKDTPSEKSRLGIGFEKLDRDAFDPWKAYDLVSELGVRYVRIQSGWQKTEKTKGVYDFGWLDAIVDELKKRGMEPWIDLCYGNRLYTESAENVFGAVGCPPIFTGREKEAWNNYVSETVRHFSGRVKWYEIWNEPDGIHCWKHGVNPHEYAEFAIATARTIQTADPKAKAIAGALCSVNLPYFKDIFEDGVCSEADAVSFHRYSADERNAADEIRALRALIDQYNPHVAIIQGESGAQSSPRGCGALKGGSWTPLKQAKHLLRNRLVDLSSEVIFTSHFTSIDMFEALNGNTDDKKSFLDYGYFGVIQADFDENGMATGNYRPKSAYKALQHLTALFHGDEIHTALPVKRMTMPSAGTFGTDESGSSVIMLGFSSARGTAMAYWNAADLMTETFEGTVSFQLAGEKEAPLLINLLSGDVYRIPDGMIKRESAMITGLINLPLSDTPFILAFGKFADYETDRIGAEKS